MSVDVETNNHLIQVWDGEALDYLEPNKAKELEKAGVVQIATGLRAMDLKPLSAFVKESPPESSPKEDESKRQGSDSKTQEPKQDNTKTQGAGKHIKTSRYLTREQRASE